MVPGQDIFQKQACNINNRYITTHSKQDRKHIEKVIYYLFWDYCSNVFYSATMWIVQPKDNFEMDFLKFTFAPKTEQKYFCISALAYKKRSNQKSSVREAK